MEAYEQSVARVDAALARLNATLEAYRVSGSKSPSNNAAKSHSAIESQKSAPGTASEQGETSHGVTMPKGMIAPQPKSEDPLWQEVLELRLDGEWKNSSTTAQQADDLNQAVRRIHEVLGEHPYSLPLYILLAYKFSQLGFPDLAAGASYKALLLSDAVRDSSDEYHVQACAALREVIAQKPLPERIDVLRRELQSDAAAPGLRMQELSEEQDIEMDIWIRGHYLGLIYHILVRSLILCGCLQSAEGYLTQLTLHCRNKALVAECVNELHAKVAKHFKVADFSSLPDDSRNATEWPDQGYVRREKYPWNDYEPDRYSNLEELNDLMSEVAPKLEIRAVQLPSLASDPSSTVTQLGVFAKEDLAPGEAILTETSMLTANNKLQDTLCDACSADLPDLTSLTITSCPDCEAVFCTSTCLTLANETYHPAVCDTDAETLAKDVPPTEAADALYALLLLRSLAMAETQETHPLLLKEVKYIWGDFSHTPSPQSPVHEVEKTLPFSFNNNIRLPFHMLEKMNIDIFACAAQYDVWVFNTLYAKFRGTASARLSGSQARGGKMRGPEVGAVHPMWCMANHSCDPNVGWEWGGSVTFTVREERARWEEKEGRKEPGVKRGQEVLNHYCDVGLEVKERREWARGALGGDCRCERCVFEAEGA